MTGARRDPQLPDVATAAEQGLPGVQSIGFQGIVGPAGMPREIVERLNREFNAAMKRPEVIAAMEGQAFTLVPGTPDSFAALVREQIETYRNLLRQAGIQPE